MLCCSGNYVNDRMCTSSELEFFKSEQNDGLNLFVFHCNDIALAMNSSNERICMH